MKIFIMRKGKKRWETITFLSVIMTGFVLFYSSCQKQESNDILSNSQLVKEAQKYYSEVVEEKEKELLAKPYSELASYSAERKFARMQKLGEKIDWENAKEYLHNKEKYLVAPIKGEKKPFTNKTIEAVRNIIFYKNTVGQMGMNIVEIIGKKNDKIDGDFQYLSFKAFVNKETGANVALDNLTASIHFYNDSYSRTVSYQAERGSMAKSHNRLLNGIGQPKNREVPTLVGRTTCVTCQTYYLIGIWFDLQTGQVIDYIVLDAWNDCTGGGPPVGYGSDPNSTPSSQDEQCFNDAANDFEGAVSAVSVSNVTEGFNFTTISPLKKKKDPEWKALNGGLNMWYLRSTEHGIIEYDPVYTRWEWVSLEHHSLEMIGVSNIGGEVSIQSHNGTPSFTEGTPNVLYAGMSLSFTVKYTPSPIPCPPFNMIIPPKIIDYTSTALWNANPQ